MSTFYKLHPVVVDETTIGEIMSLALSDGITTQRLTADGYVDHTASLVNMFDPGITLVTLDIATALGVAGYNGAAVEDVVAYEGLITPEGAKSSSSNSVSWTFATAFAYPVSLNWTQNSAATLTMAILGTSSTGDNPLAKATNATLPTPTIDYDERWTLEDVRVNNAQIVDISDVTIDFGIQPRGRRFDGAVGVRSYHVTDRPTAIEFSTMNAAAAIQAFTAISNTTVVRLRKWNADGTKVSTASTVHQTYTVNGGAIIPINTDGDPRVKRYRIECNRTASAVPMTIALGVALS